VVLLRERALLEWQKPPDPSCRSLFAMKDGRPFTFAGLLENWKDPESGECASRASGVP
jgi:hypothetical protein